MLKKDFINKVRANSGFTNVEIEKFLNAILDTIVECVANDEKVAFKDFGCFEAKNRAEKKCLNPATGKLMDLPAYKTPVFKAGKAFKNRVNK